MAGCLSLLCVRHWASWFCGTAYSVSMTCKILVMFTLFRWKDGSSEGIFVQYQKAVKSEPRSLWPQSPNLLLHSLPKTTKSSIHDLCNIIVNMIPKCWNVWEEDIQRKLSYFILLFLAHSPDFWVTYLRCSWHLYSVIGIYVPSLAQYS